MTAVALHETLLDACLLETDIKWPNDIMVNEKKLCGILAETTETPLGRAVIVGVGINLTSNSLSPELNGIATSVKSATGKTPELEVILEALLRSLVRHYQVLLRPNGPETILHQWCSRSSFAEGKRVMVTEGSEGFVGTTRGLGIDGGLQVETDDGEIRIVRAGDVTVVRAVSE
jgi:BirA family biotin operon repressor/biotin-[acetyl-CoA-carboxylase] ligase